MYECDFMTPEGCKARETAKQLQMQAIMEGNSEEMMYLCSEKCCYDCKLVSRCSYRCGKAMKAEQNKVKDDGNIDV